MEVDRLVQRADALHFLLCKRKVEHIYVLLHTLDVCAFGDGDDVPLQEITQSCLLRSLAVFF